MSERADAKEVNLAFTIENNLLRLNTLTIDARPGRFFLGSAQSRTIVHPTFAGPEPLRRVRLNFNERGGRTVEPIVTDLTGLGDAIVGFDAWAGETITIDYIAGLVTFQERIEGGGMTIYRFQDEPAVTVVINGQPIEAAVDTANPDTLLLPRGSSPAGRIRARVEIAGTTFDSVDVALADVSRPRIGNRLLSKFLISIDYGRQQVGLWRDTRIPLE